ncbi:MAG: D-glycero-beta-D-manno-heptose-7-phosphate kinase [Burkholderiaceae bacterium]|nr:MAG: D-glycero-beta-D-manno-heptose-7-phosphate kinase [Burkholderiaceae bacterium]
MQQYTPEQLKQARVLVIGDLMLDRYWFGDAHRISPEAPVPVVRIERTEDRLGGAANVARNAQTLGAATAIMGVVGQDEAGDRVESLLQEENIKTHVQRDASLPTTIKLRVIGRQQQLIRVDFESTPSHDVLLGKLELFKSILPDFDVIVLSDYGKGGLTHIREMIAAARAAGKKVLVDPKGRDYARYTGASLLTPNRAELRDVIGAWQDEAELEQKAQALRKQLDLEGLLLTRSEEGMSLFQEAPTLHVSAQAREVYDVSGAGDTVIATLAVMLGIHAPLHDAVQMANRAGGIVVGKLGTAVVTPAELFQEAQS